MLESLTSINLPPNTPWIGDKGDCFVLKTCQRVLMLGLGDAPVKIFQSQHSSVKERSVLWQGAEAYGMVLEIMCGLQSKILAENEVAAQFRRAYRDYTQEQCKNTLILNILEKLLADSKKIRSTHLREIGTRSYGGIVRKIILSQSGEQKGRRVLIKGSGVLAEQIAKLLKKSFSVYMSARNVDKLASLTECYGISPLRWGDSTLYKEFPLIINTVGAEDIIFPKEFFYSWYGRHHQPLYIDLGCPSSIDTDIDKKEGVWCLEDVLRTGQKWAQDSEEKAECARQEIRSLLEHRHRYFGINGKELQFN